jgi:HSP20 family protein
MSMDRWDPFRDMMTFREVMDRWLQQSISGTGQLIANMRPESIPVDLIEHDESFEIRAAVPGVKPDDVEVTVQGERLTIRAEVRTDEERREDNWLMREHRAGSLQRSVTLPSPVSSESAQARVENGVLTLILPKVQATQPHRISVATTPPITSSDTPLVQTETARHAAHGSRDATAEGDRVTEESQESFPASDPPSQSPGTA